MNKAIAVVFAALGLAFTSAAVIYAIRPANSLPAFMPGYSRTLHRIHYAHAAAALAVGLVFDLLAWRVGRKHPKRAISERVVAWLVKRGRGRSECYLVEVRGRRTGRPYSTPINVLVYDDMLYAVGRQGSTAWVRNAQASGLVTLVKGKTRERFEVRAIPDANKSSVLKAYRDRFKAAHRYFPIQAGSPVGDFVPIAERYPVFELLPLTRETTPRSPTDRQS